MMSSKIAGLYLIILTPHEVAYDVLVTHGGHHTPVELSFIVTHRMTTSLALICAQHW